MMRDAEPLLRVKGLNVSLPTADGLIQVVHHVDLEVWSGRVCGIAGESGSGKTISMMAMLGLLPKGSIATGEALFRGANLLTASNQELSKRRGKDIGLVMQDPHASLHPMLSVGQQLTDHIRHHLRVSQRAAKERALELLHEVHIPDPRGSFHGYPHQFSGGMCQRIAIAIALACGPSVLIADEPTTGLDVTVQAGILRLLHDLAEVHQVAIVLITHDLGVMSALADTLTVMYAGTVVESGSAAAIIATPRHPYTAAMLAALPHPDRPEDLLLPIPGHLGQPSEWPPGCPFHPRCSHAEARCTEVLPDHTTVGDGRRLACLVDPFGHGS